MLSDDHAFDSEGPARVRRTSMVLRIHVSETQKGVVLPGVFEAVTMSIGSSADRGPLIYQAALATLHAGSGR